MHRRIRRKLSLRRAVRLGILLSGPAERGAFWVYGELDSFSYSAVVFPDRPPEPFHELERSRIAKLVIARETETENVLLLRFSNRWVINPGFYDVLGDYRLLVDNLANAVFPPTRHGALIRFLRMSMQRLLGR